MAPTKTPKAKADGQTAIDDITLAESEAELESGDLFADENEHEEEDAPISRVIDSLDEMIFEEDASEEAVEAEIEAGFASLENDQTEAVEEVEDFLADEYESDEEAAIADVAAPEATLPEPAPATQAVVFEEELTEAPRIVPDNAVDFGVTAATEKIAEAGTSQADPALAADPGATESMPDHLKIPDEFIAMDPQEAEAISRRLTAPPPDPTSDTSFVEEAPEYEIDIGLGPEPEPEAEPEAEPEVVAAVEAAAPTGKKSSRAGLVVGAALVLVVGAVLVYFFAIREAPGSSTTSKRSNGAIVPVESPSRLPERPPEPESGPIVFGNATTKPTPSPKRSAARGNITTPPPSNHSSGATTPPAVVAESSDRSPAKSRPPAVSAKSRAALAKSSDRSLETNVADPSINRPSATVAPPGPAKKSTDSPSSATPPAVAEGEIDRPGATTPPPLVEPQTRNPQNPDGDSVDTRSNTADPPAATETSNPVARQPSTSGSPEPQPLPTTNQDAAPQRPALLPPTSGNSPEPEPVVLTHEPSVPYDVAPSLIVGSRAKPRYPAAAARLRISGTVLMTATIGVDGRVTSVDVVNDSSPRMGFGDAAMKAVRRWKYRPATLDGKPVEASLSVHVSFTP